MEEISLVDILRILYRKKRTILITILAGVMISGVFYFVTNENIYEYSATIYTKGNLDKDSKSNIEKEDKISNEDATIQELQIGEQLAKDYISFLNSTFVLENIQEKLRKKYDQFNNKNYNQVNSYIKGKINVNSKGDDSRFLEIRASDKKSKLAKDIVKYTVEELKESAAEVLGSGNVKIVDVSFVGENNDGARNAGIVFALVFIIGIGVVFSTEFLNETINNVDEIGNKFTIKIIGDIKDC